MKEMIDLGQIKRQSDNLIKDLEERDFSFLPELKIDFCLKEEQEVKIKAVILAMIVQVGFDHIKASEIIEYLTDHDLKRFLTHKELAFLSNASQEDKNNETWKSECLWVLLWSLSLVESIDDPINLGDLNTIKAEDYPFIDIKTDVEKFIQRPVKLRSEVEIIEKLDFYSRLDYICDWSLINNLETSINSALVYERRYALCWLTTVVEWDKVKCDSIL